MCCSILNTSIHKWLVYYRLKCFKLTCMVYSPNLKIVSSIIKQSEYLDEELLSKANNKIYIPDEFNKALKNLNLASNFLYAS